MTSTSSRIVARWKLANEAPTNRADVHPHPALPDPSFEILVGVSKGLGLHVYGKPNLFSIESLNQDISAEDLQHLFKVAWSAAAERARQENFVGHGFNILNPPALDFSRYWEPVKQASMVDLGTLDFSRYAVACRVAARYKNKKKTEKGNTVYMYSERQIAHRNRKKAERIEKLRKSMGKLRTKVKRDLKSSDPEKILTALAVALIDHTYERVGNEESAKDGHFGVTGWKKKHISFSPKGATIKYVGKAGVKHEKKVTDASIKAALRDAYEACDDDGDCLFSREGVKVTSEKVNEYLDAFDITAKDLRGFHANREMQDRLKAIRSKGKKLPEDKKAKEKLLKAEFLKALDETSEAVGHEASTLRSQYLVPGLEETFMKDGTVSDKLGYVLGYEIDDLAENIVRRHLVAREIRLDLAWVEGLRKDFLTLLKNLPRVHDYKTAHQLRDAFQVYRKNFDDLFFEHFLNNDLKYNQGISEGDVKWYDKKLRGPAWSFSTELRPPIGFADEYRTEAVQFAEFQREYPQWKARVQRKAQLFWKEMKDFLDYYTRVHDKPGIDVQVPAIENATLEGFKLVMKGFKEGDEYHEKELAVLKEGLKLYRQRASAVAPILLKKQLPVFIEFKTTLDKGGEYNHDGTITFFASSISNKGPKWVAHAMAHEMGHHLWRAALSKEAQNYWYATIRGDYGDLDIQELLNKWPGDTWAYDFPRVLGETDPILALQVDAVSHEGGRGGRDLQTKEDFQKLLDSGQKTIIVPKTPITGYANKSPEEAFSETIGLLVAYGPRALDPKVRMWLDTALPGAFKSASYDHRPTE